VSVRHATIDTAAASQVQVGSGELDIISIRDLNAPSNVEQGEQYTVEARIVNLGNDDIAKQMSYRVAGNVVQSELVQLNAGASATVTFNVTIGQFPSGTYTHGVYTNSARTTAMLEITEGNETDDEQLNQPEETTTAEGDEQTTTETTDEEAEEDETTTEMTDEETEDEETTTAEA